MPTLMLGVFDHTNDDIAIGPPAHIVGQAVMAVAPDPVLAHSTSAGMYSSDGGNAIELTFNATVVGHPGVTLFIDIWIRGRTFEKLIVTSSDPANYPIEGKYERVEEPDVFYCGITVG
jgi:hypothetical protein